MSLLDFVLQLVQTNEFLQGGVVTVLVGGALAWARGIPGRIWDFCQSKVSCSLVLEGTDSEYPLFAKWCYTNLRPWRAGSYRVPWNAKWDEEAKLIGLLPNSVTLFGFWRGRVVWATVVPREIKSYGGNSGVTMTADLSITITPGNRHTCAELMQDVVKERPVLMGVADKLIVRFPSDFSDRDRKMNKRPLSSVCLPSGVADDILSDARRFFESEEEYARKSIPWRRGFLFHGEPGCGKTITAMALASDLNVPIYYINPSKKSDDSFVDAMNSACKKSIVLIEDIDCAGANVSDRDGDDGKGMPIGPSMSAILNSIDGLMAPEGRLLIMTTNKPESIDAAIKRPGRCDRSFHFGTATSEQIEAMAKRLEVPVTPEIVSELVGLSLAEVQVRLMMNGDE